MIGRGRISSVSNWRQTHYGELERTAATPMEPKPAIGRISRRPYTSLWDLIGGPPRSLNILRDGQRAMAGFCPFPDPDPNCGPGQFEGTTTY